LPNVAYLPLLAYHRRVPFIIIELREDHHFSAAAPQDHTVASTKMTSILSRRNPFIHCIEQTCNTMRRSEMIAESITSDLKFCQLAVVRITEVAACKVWLLQKVGIFTVNELHL
jgi:hypothetical protein